MLRKKTISLELVNKFTADLLSEGLVEKSVKKEAKELKEKINEFVNVNLKLQLNDKTRYYPNKIGVDFCGYRIFETHILLRNRCKKKIIKNIRKWNLKYSNNELDLIKVREQFNSWLGHTKHANSYNFRYKMFNSIKFNEKLISLNVSVK